MSTYRDDSELIAFNEAPLDEWQPLSNELIDVLAISQSVAEASHGAFDITVGDLVNLWSFGPGARPETVPSDDALSEELAQVGIDALEIDTQNMQARRTRDVFVDLSGVAKGHGTDRVAAYLEQQGLEHYLVNIGGELIARGLRDEEEQTPWQIGIEVPEDVQQRAQHIIPLESMSVATSGDYRNYFEVNGQRFSHTIDPRTGRPVTHQLASVSVFHPPMPGQMPGRRRYWWLASRRRCNWPLRITLKCFCSCVMASSGAALLARNLLIILGKRWLMSWALNNDEPQRPTVPPQTARRPLTHQ